MLKFAFTSQNIEKKIILSKKRGEITRFDGTHEIVAHAISVEFVIFTIFFDVSQLSYRPSNFARANKPYATG